MASVNTLPCRGGRGAETLSSPADISVVKLQGTLRWSPRLLSEPRRLSSLPQQRSPLPSPPWQPPPRRPSLFVAAQVAARPYWGNVSVITVRTFKFPDYFRNCIEGKNYIYLYIFFTIVYVLPLCEPVWGQCKGCCRSISNLRGSSQNRKYTTPKFFSHCLTDF